MKIILDVKVDKEIDTASKFYNMYGRWYEFLFNNGALKVDPEDYDFLNKVMKIKVIIPFAQYYSFTELLNSSIAPRQSMCTYHKKIF